MKKEYKQILDLYLDTLRCYMLTGFIIAVIAIFAMNLTGCSGANELTGDNNVGDVIVGLTDANGDFVHYEVNVESLTLTKANGAVVETVPLTTRVDFAQYTDMTEFFTAATIPSGVYNSAKIKLNFTGAKIQVEDDTGAAVNVTSIKDTSGNELGAMELNVKLEGKSSLTILPGVPAHLTLDFDLNASNVVTFDSSTNEPVLTVTPLLIASVNATDPKMHRVRGPLKSVDVGDSSFRVIIRPFIHVLSGQDEKFGTLKVVTASDTVYEINGTAYQGSAVLSKLGELSQFTAVVVVGDIKFNPHRFEAREVYAGNSVPGGNMDAVTGNVIKRVGDVITIKGATLIRNGGSVIFNDKVEVTLAGTTKVFRQLSMEAYAIDDISIGQRVTVFGTLTNDQAASLAMDAGNGYVHMLLTTLRGTVSSNDAVFALKLQSIDGRYVGLFDFTGTGMAQDADKNNYVLDTVSLDVSNLPVDTTLKVRGFVKPFGTDQLKFFTVQTIVDVSDVNAHMAVLWLLPNANHLTSITSDGLALNLDGTLWFHHLWQAGVVINLKTDISGQSPLVKANDSGEGSFFISQNRTLQLYTTFDSFVDALNTRLSNGAGVRSITATGKFNEPSATLTSKSLNVLLQ